MKKILFLICLVLGCRSEAAGGEGRDHQIDYNVDQLSSILIYYKDTKTGVCYSAAYGGFNGSIFTYVPCTPEVENAAHKFKSGSNKR